MLQKDDLEKNLDRVHEWIKAADQKVSIFLALQGIITTLLSVDIFSWITNIIQNFTYPNVIIIVSATVFAGVSIYKSASAITPRLKNNRNKSITYFGDIARFDLEDYKRAIKATDTNNYERGLIEQIHISSKIALRKHTQFRDSIFYFVGCIILFIFSFLIYKI